MYLNYKNNISQIFKTVGITKNSDEFIQKEINYNDFKYINNFKKQSLDFRLEVSNKILNKYGDRIPIIVDCKSDIKIDKNKYIVPIDLNIGQFLYIIKKRINIQSTETIFLLSNNHLLVNTDILSNIYNKHKDIDKFLYIIVTKENTFGNI